MVLAAGAAASVLASALLISSVEVAKAALYHGVISVVEAQVSVSLVSSVV